VCAGLVVVGTFTGLGVVCSNKGRSLVKGVAAVGKGIRGWEATGEDCGVCAEAAAADNGRGNVAYACIESGSGGNDGGGVAEEGRVSMEWHAGGVEVADEGGGEREGEGEGKRAAAAAEGGRSAGDEGGWGSGGCGGRNVSCHTSAAHAACG